MTEKLTAVVYDGLTGLTIERELNEEELNERLLVSSALAEKESEEKSALEARKSALAKLAKLGLTKEEIASL
jgi:hypothetical protein